MQKRLLFLVQCSVGLRAPVRRAAPPVLCASGSWRRRSTSSLRAEEARLARVGAEADEGAINSMERAVVNAVGGENAATYGEITPRGFATLASRMRLDEHAHFADLGSGTGKAVLQAVREFGVASACGIELAASRHGLSQAALLVQPDSVASRVRFVEGDCAARDAWREGGPLASTTDVWLCSLLFGPALMERLARRLSADGSRVRQVASLRRFPGGLPGFVEEEPPEPCEMSWTAKLLVASTAAEWEHPGALVYLYRRAA